VLSWELAEELLDVLRRPKLRKYQIEEQDIEDVLQLIASDLPAVDVDTELRDAEDAPIVAAAIAGNARAIVTGDADFLDEQQLRRWLGERGVEVLTPADLLERLRT
jgi:putative PIN family toxin of toxin-antitoxin system